MGLHLFQVTCFVDNGMERFTTTKRVFCYTPDDATATIMQMYKDNGDLVRHISTYEIELHDRMVI